MPSKLTHKPNLTEEELLNSKTRYSQIALTLICLLLLSIPLLGQNLTISGNCFEGKGKLSGVDVKLKKGSSVVTQTQTDAAGFFQLSMALDDEYTIYFEKSGFASKKIEINTKDVPEAERKGDFSFPRWSVELYSKDHNINYSLLNKPVGIVMFLPYNSDFGIDPDYAAEIRPQLDELENQVAAEIKAKEQEAVQLEADYKQAIKDGNNYLKTKEYDNALEAFYAAKDIKPDEAYPKEQIEKTLALVEAQKDIEEQYGNFLTLADDALAEENWDEAKSNYEQAISIKPKEAYPKQQLAKVDKLKAEADAAKLKEAYDALIAEADAAFQSEKFDEAKPLYQEASSKMPKQPYPKAQIKAIDVKLAAKAKEDAEYNNLIATADGLMTSDKFEEAIAEFKKASGIKPDESYPKEKITELEQAIKDREAAKEAEKEKIKAEFDKLVADADAAFGKSEFETAKGIYNQALAKLPDESYPKGKIAECDKKIAELSKQNAEYQKAIDKAEKLFASEKLAEAKTAFEQALALKEDEYPKSKIAEIDNLVAQKEKAEAEAKAAAEAEAAKLKAEYDKLIADGDAAFSSGDYSGAKDKFNQAIDKMPDESYPKSKIKECDSKLGELAKVDEAYQKSIAKADELLNNSSFDEAKAEYENALTIKDDPYPKEQISQIATLKAEAEEQAQALAEAEAAMKQEEEYNEAVAKADKLYDSEKWDEAKVAYQAAIAIKDEGTLQEKIAEIDQKQADLLAAEEAAKKAAEQAAIDEKYNSALAKADKLLESQKWDEAKAAYQAAQAIKDDGSIPPKLAQIDQLQADQLAAAEAEKAAAEQAAKEAAEAEAKAALDKQYNEALAKADKLMGSEKWDEAKAAYQAAQAIKDDGSIPPKLAQIDQLQADQLAAAEAEKAAAEQAAKEAAEAEAQAALDKQYNEALAKADKLMGNEKWDEAKAAYQAAQAIKDDGSIPPKLAQIDQLQADQLAAAEAEKAAAKEAAEAEAQAALDKQYNEALAKADKLMGNEKWDEAKAAYQAAQAIKDDGSIPPKLAQIDQLQADQLAAAEAEKAAAEQAAKDAAEAEAQAEIDKKYNEALAKADKLMGNEKWDEAKAAYQAAQAIKDDGSIPPKIAQIDQLQADQLAAAEAEKTAAEQAAKDAAEAEAQAALDKQYNEALAKADKLMGNEKWDEAKAAYQAAQAIKDDGSIPPKLAQIDQLQADQLAAAEAEKSAAKEAAEAEAQAALDKQYNEALAKADKLMGNEKWDEAKAAYQAAQAIKDDGSIPPKIAQIDQLQADQLAAAEAEKSAAEQAAKEAAVESEYKNALANADKLLKQKQYEDARIAYSDALEIKPQEQYPKDKIDEIEAIFEGIELAEKSKEEELRAEYEALISEADNLLSTKDYDGAKKKYKEAKKTLSSESYPDEKINEIETLLSNLASAEDNYKQAIKEGDKSLKNGDLNQAKSSFEAALSIKPDESYPSEKISEIESQLLAQKQAEDQRKAEEEARLLAEKEAEDKRKREEAELLAQQEAAKKAEEDRIRKEAEAKRAKEEAAKAALLAKQKAEEEAARKAEEERLAKLEADRAALQAKAEEEARRKREAADRKNKELRSKYESAIAEADRAFNSNQFKVAKEGYKKAQLIIPSESYPADQLLAIDEKINNEKKSEGEYNSLVARGDKLILLKDYENALSKFEKANSLKPSESYPEDRISYIRNIIDNLSSAEADRMKRLKEKNDRIDKEYNEFIAQADKAMSEEFYGEAKNKYFKAIEIKPKEYYPHQQIEEVKRLSKLKVAREQKAREEEALRKKREQEYNQLIAEGDHFYKTGNYKTAIQRFNKAASNELADSYPGKRASEIKSELRDKENEAKELQRKREEEEKKRLEFVQTVAIADSYLGQKDYENAITNFEKALDLYPENEKAAAKLREAERALRDQSALADRKEKEESERKNKISEYRSLIAEADQLYLRRNYEKALSKYKESLRYMPDQSHPKVRINKINLKLAEAARKQQLLANKETPRKISPLASKYPQGVTENVVEEGNRKTTSIVIIDGDDGNEYNMIEYTFGKVYFLKNGKPYSEKLWKNETGR